MIIENDIITIEITEDILKSAVEHPTPRREPLSLGLVDCLALVIE
jgi:hypothetical protein